MLSIRALSAVSEMPMQLLHIFALSGAYLHLDSSDVMNAAASGIFLHPGSKATLSRCNINQNGHSGVSAAPTAICFLKRCVLNSNGGAHISVRKSVHIVLSVLGLDRL